MTISWSRPLGRGGLPGAVISSAYGMRSGIALLMCFALHSPSGCSRAENQRNPNPTPVPIACVAPHFFEKYRGAGLATSARTDEIRIEPPVDLHSADCGAPDSYGHRMTLRLTLGAESGRCRIRSAVADAHPYGDTAESGLEPWRDAFVPVNDPIWRTRRSNGSSYAIRTRTTRFCSCPALTTSTKTSRPPRS